MRLINSARAGEILKVTTNRVRTLVKQGYLKDYNGNGEGKHHFCKVDLDEVKEFKNKYYILQPRGVAPRDDAKDSPVSKSKPVVVTKMPEPINPVKSFGDRLSAIEAKLDKLIKLWS